MSKKAFFEESGHLSQDMKDELELTEVKSGGRIKVEFWVRRAAHPEVGCGCELEELNKSEVGMARG